jgi:Flp pilus assembly protein TadD
MRGFARISFVGAALACAGTLAAVGAPACAQGSYSPYDETAAAALSRYVRALAADSQDFNSLVGAGRAALELGDTQAAAGFFARADAVNPRSPLPQAGMGAVSVANGEPKAAMPYFTRAMQLGATQAMIGCDRGLAYDLMGQQANAQADYRAAMGGADGDKARRRMALSLAISGDKAGALDAIAPLSAKGDSATPRVRAFVLALSGDTANAMRLINVSMPDSSSTVAPFIQRLASLAAGQKAAAVNLGIFPDSNNPGISYAATAPVAQVAAPSTARIAETVTTDRLAGIDALLRQQSAPAQPVAQTMRPVQVAYTPQVRPATVQRTVAPVKQKIWLQLAMSDDASALSRKYARLKSQYPDLFSGIPGYLAQNGDDARLVVGPFRGPSDASIFADDLSSVGVNADRWTNSATDRIVPVAAE